MASSTAMKVIDLTDEKVYTNSAFVSSTDLDDFSTWTPSCSLFSSSKKYQYALMNDRIVLLLLKDEKLQTGQLGLNAEHCNFADISSGNSAVLEVFTPPKGFDLSVLTIEVELLDGSSTPSKPVMASTLKREFGKNFHKQVFTEYQCVIMRHQDISYRCTVVDVSITRGISLAPKRGMVCKRTKIIVEVHDSLRDHISGAKIIKSILREGLNTDSLEEELASLGIGGMISHFHEILQRAFGSRMVSPVQVKRLNLKHVKGMLLHGPPGSGKTLVARSLCKILNVKEPLIVSGPELEQEYYGVTERNIRSLFEEAMKDEKQSGAESDLHIIVFDEFDSIAKKRGSANQHHGDKVVNQLLTMIDGMSEMNNIFIIATTNRKELIDEALLRPGRIELHIKLDYPDEKGRLDILDVCTRCLRKAFLLDIDVDLTEIARKTHGCSGAALASLVGQAHTYANVQNGENGFLKHVGRTKKLNMNHFLRAVEDSISKLQELDELRMEKGEMMSPHSISSAYKAEFDELLEENKHLKAEFSDLKMKMEKLADRASLEQELEDLIKLGCHISD